MKNIREMKEKEMAFILFRIAHPLKHTILVSH